MYDENHGQDLLSEITKVSKVFPEADSHIQKKMAMY